MLLDCSRKNVNQLQTWNFYCFYRHDDVGNEVFSYFFRWLESFSNSWFTCKSLFLIHYEIQTYRTFSCFLVLNTKWLGSCHNFRTPLRWLMTSMMFENNWITHSICFRQNICSIHNIWDDIRCCCSHLLDLSNYIIIIIIIHDIETQCWVWRISPYSSSSQD